MPLTAMGGGFANYTAKLLDPIGGTKFRPVDGDRSHGFRTVLDPRKKKEERNDLVDHPGR